MRDRETMGGINPSHDATHDIKKFPGKEHERPEDDSYRNLRKRELGKTFTPLEEMPDASGSSDPLFLTAMEELREKIKRQEMTLEEIDVDETAHEFGVNREDVEDALSLEEGGVEEEISAEEKKNILFGTKEKQPVKETSRSILSSSMVRGGTVVRRGMKSGDVLNSALHAQDKQYENRRMPGNKPRYKAPGDKYLKTVRTEQPPEQQA